MHEMGSRFIDARTASDADFEDFFKDVVMNVEAFGNFDAAVRAGCIVSESGFVEYVRQFVPPSRGGNDQRPDAEREWKSIVDLIAFLRGKDCFERVREAMQERPDDE